MVNTYGQLAQTISDADRQNDQREGAKREQVFAEEHVINIKAYVCVADFRQLASELEAVRTDWPTRLESFH